MKKLVVAAALAVLACGSAGAVHLINKDSESYSIRVKHGSSTMTGSIGGGTTKNDLCSDECTITISGSGVVSGYETATASGSTDLVIRDGKIAAD